MKAQSSAPVKEKTLKIISDLLTDICDESTTGKDTNNCKLFHNFISLLLIIPSKTFHSSISLLANSVSFYHFIYSHK